MTNFQVYKKTLIFSLIIFLVDLIPLGILAGAAIGGFYIARGGEPGSGVFGLIIGLVLGAIIGAVFNLLVTNRIKAAQIAMMTKGVADNALPETGVVKAGFDEVHGRFAKITVFFIVTSAIKGVFRQIGRGITKLGSAVGGDVGGSIGSAIDSAIQTLIGYLADCCLGWVMYRKDQGVATSACEGAVIFFKHGKTLIRNIGRIFGMGALSFLVIGGAFFGIGYLVFSQFPTLAQTIATEIAEFGEDVPAWLTNPSTVIIAAAALGGIIIWSILHSVLIRPFILVGVLRNFMAAGKEHMPTEEDFKELDRTSPRFAKLRSKNI